MDMRYVSNFRTRLSDLFKSFSRIQFLSSKSKKDSPTLKGAALMISGLILALSCYEWSSSVGAKDFDQANWPRKKVWSGTLNSFGFKNTSISESSNLLENHPNPYLLSSQIWLREDGNVIYITRSPYAKQEPEFWVRTGVKVIGSRKLNWINLSSGVSAFNELIRKLEDQKPIQKSKISRNLVDPKEIRY